ncbi:malto-oligosyltrehalose trehalohydrolase [Actinokineospora globicatena]|uniref:malto-oligosyltrehalose trehalohydrolase n=1 Tax=Actinokineospora globicatena TaxID=103729 RepID=UPI0020A30FEF|nr:malto-oligosyltrehalose trehalohydrolase [Actinokineospora globicatena]MCP2302238.1 maltooligosyltrehalose trehalohydrolase [Actinokineospora globicatena]GLW76098.1 malto-oligosyltrehalose trehalohydrolase [Actinokineospora globicatena]GLW82933.1 malto-oligosyltrehalose trehalohydrolase [Actinokineospora globicatena]
MDEPFSVWAPQRSRVRLYVDGARHEMARDDRGWWHAEVPGAGPGSDYAFLLDDDETPLPDPRSLWQPQGVHGPSRRYEHRAYEWGDSAWTGRPVAGRVIYELHIGTFTPAGTFAGAAEKLDHLVDLGVDFVEVLPVNAFDGVAGWGYDGVLWGATHEPYGGPDGFKRFVDACHQRGLGVILDVVYNHLGPSGAYLDRFGPYFAGKNIWGPTLNLDGPDSDEVRRYVIENALGWLRDFHIDGLRLDAVHALVDTRATHLLEELAVAVEVLSTGLGRPLSLIAESDLNDPRHVTPRAAGGLGLDAQWCDDIHHSLHVALTGETSGYYADFEGALPTTLRSAFFHAGTWSSFRHRTHGRPVDPLTTPGHRFLAYLQNHDQIGNRATGDRLTATVPTARLLCGAALVFCSPYTPMLFMGEEWAASTPWQFFASFPDQELAEAVRTGRRREFAEHGWGESEVPDPMSPATVAASTLDWSEPASGDHRSVLETYRSLISLRRNHPELADPRLDRFTVQEIDGCLLLHRGSLRVAVNLGTGPATVPLRAKSILLTSEAVTTGSDSLILPPNTFAVVGL